MRWLLIATAVSWALGLWSAFQAFRYPGLLRTPTRLLSAVLYAALGLLLGSVFMLLHFFLAFSGETLVARVAVQRLSPPEFELVYTPAASAGGEAQHVRLEGDQWSVSGGIVKWHPVLTALGMKSYHRPMRLSGQFSDVSQQRSHLPTVYPLEPAVDRFWEAFYWADAYLPFVEAVYGSSAYVYVQPGVVQENYVTPSGYLIKRAQP